MAKRNPIKRSPRGRTFEGVEFLEIPMGLHPGISLRKFASKLCVEQSGWGRRLKLEIYVVPDDADPDVEFQPMIEPPEDGSDK